MRRMKAVIWSIVLLVVAGCCRETETPVIDTDGQSFVVFVESDGELFGDPPVPETRRPISSVAPVQTFDRLSLVVVEYRSPARVVWRMDLDHWSSPDNRTSSPWSDASSQGRYARVRLQDRSSLADGEYLVYAIGWQSGSYGGYEPFSGVETGDFFRHTEVAEVPAGERADEVFAGAERFSVRNGVLSSVSGNVSGIFGEAPVPVVVLRRQVAGTFGYFTGVPAVVDGHPVAAVRMVATKSNRGVIFGGFRSVDEGVEFNKENVVNGMNPRADYEAMLHGSDERDAFVVYEIDLSRWFPGSPEEGLPLDANGDGVLDASDENWQVDGTAYPDGAIALPRGTVFGDSFLVSFAVTADDVAIGKPTFELQLVDKEGVPLKSWEVNLESEEEAVARTQVSLPEGQEGQTVITELENVDTDLTFSVVRNRLYTLGEKNFGQGVAEDRPVELNRASRLVLEARHRWEIAGLILF